MSADDTSPPTTCQKRHISQSNQKKYPVLHYSLSENTSNYGNQNALDFELNSNTMKDNINNLMSQSLQDLLAKEKAH